MLWLMFIAMILTSGPSTNQSAGLPAHYTLAQIENALKEFINYRFWFYPAAIVEELEEEEFESYIGKEIEVEVRSYNGEIYASTSVGQWLAYFNVKNGILYCVGLIYPNVPMWPGNDYTVSGDFRFKVEEPHKPNYGSSPYKDSMLTAALSYLEKYCEDMNSGAERDKWIDVEGYLADFYEYEDGTSAWFIRNDEEAVNVPMLFDKENNIIKVEGLKGHSLKNVYSLNPDELGRYLFDKQIHDAVRKVSCVVDK